MSCRVLGVWECVCEVLAVRVKMKEIRFCLLTIEAALRDGTVNEIKPIIIQSNSVLIYNLKANDMRFIFFL